MGPGAPEVQSLIRELIQLLGSAGVSPLLFLQSFDGFEVSALFALGFYIVSS